MSRILKKGLAQIKLRSTNDTFEHKKIIYARTLHKKPNAKYAIIKRYVLFCASN
jgi:hypothetical protein